METRQVVLPPLRNHKTPMPLRTDAYTVGSPSFQSDEATKNSVYYATHRHALKQINKDFYGDDNRIIIIGLQRIVEETLREACTIRDVEESVGSLATFKATTEGLKPYPFPKDLWIRVVNEFNGRPPIRIDAVPEGTVVYPNEPFLQCYPTVEGFGELAAWFECKCLQSYGMTERVTQNEHFLIKLKDRIRKIDSKMPEDQVHFIASTLLVDFGDRAGFNQKESEDMGLAHLYTFPGTDNLSGNYQAFKNAEDKVRGCSILALAHRNVQAFPSEKDCYEALNRVLEDGDLGSFVSDLNDYKKAVTKYGIPIVLENVRKNNKKVYVFRPDSGDVRDQVRWTLSELEKFGLTKKTYVDGKVWNVTIQSKLILADGLTLMDMLSIIDLVTKLGYLFYEVLVFGSGGGLRNGLKRDNLSSKYALDSYGDGISVCKFSEDEGKMTLPGPLKLLRTKEALESKMTVVHISEPGDSILKMYFDGSNIWEPFGVPMYDTFDEIQRRIRQQMADMPITMLTETNHNFPISKYLYDMRLELMKTNSPDKYEHYMKSV